MIQAVLLFFAAAAVATDGFVITPQRRHHAFSPEATTKTVLLQGSSITGNDEKDATSTMAELQHEYKVLQEELLQDIVIKHDEEEARKVEERMLEIVAEATVAQEREQMEQLNDIWLHNGFGDISDFETMHKMEATSLLLGQLKHNESVLKAALERLKEEDEKAELSRQHRSFLDRVKDAIYAHPDLLASLDPHIL